MSSVTRRVRRGLRYEMVPRVHWFPGPPGALVCGEPADPPRKSTIVPSDVTCRGCREWLGNGEMPS